MRSCLPNVLLARHPEQRVGVEARVLDLDAQPVGELVAVPELEHDLQEAVAVLADGKRAILAGRRVLGHGELALVDHGLLHADAGAAASGASRCPNTR